MPDVDKPLSHVAYLDFKKKKIMREFSPVNKWGNQDSQKSNN